MCCFKDVERVQNRTFPVKRSVSNFLALELIGAVTIFRQTHPAGTSSLCMFDCRPLPEPNQQHQFRMAGNSGPMGGAGPLGGPSSMGGPCHMGGTGPMGGSGPMSGSGPMGGPGSIGGPGSMGGAGSMGTSGPMDTGRHDNFGGMQQRNFISQSDLQNANSFPQQPHTMHTKPEPFQQPQDQFHRPQDQQFPRPPDNQFQRPQDQQFPRPQDNQFQRPQDQQFQRPQDPQFQRPQDQQFQNKTDNFSYKTDQYQQNQEHFQEMPDHLQQRLDNFQIKQQEVTNTLDSTGSTRKEFGLQRQDSYTTQKTNNSFFRNTVSLYFSLSKFRVYFNKFIVEVSSYPSNNLFADITSSYND